ncbi:MAG: DsbA family protein [Gemmatimonadaceae bacterium]
MISCAALRRRSPPHAVLFLAIALGSAAVAAQESPGAGHSRGSPDARVHIIEFADFGCGHCAEFTIATFPRLDAEFIATGDVRWTTVPVSLAGFRHSRDAALTAECSAAQGRFWSLHGALFAHRDEWSRARDPWPVLRRLAADAGVAPAVLETCVRSKAARQRLADNNTAARRAGVRGTPTFLVSGRTVVGALPYVMMRDVLREALRITARVP